MTRAARRLRAHLSIHRVMAPGGIVGIQARTKVARRWLDRHVSTEREIWCERPYVDDILRGFMSYLGEDYDASVQS